LSFLHKIEQNLFIVTISRAINTCLWLHVKFHLFMLLYC